MYLCCTDGLAAFSTTDSYTDDSYAMRARFKR